MNNNYENKKKIVSKNYKKIAIEDEERVKLYSSSVSSSSSSYSIGYREKSTSYDSLQGAEFNKNEQTLQYPYEKKFCVKQLPRWRIFFTFFIESYFLSTNLINLI